MIETSPIMEVIKMKLKFPEENIRTVYKWRNKLHVKTFLFLGASLITAYKAADCAYRAGQSEAIKDLCTELNEMEVEVNPKN